MLTRRDTMLLAGAAGAAALVPLGAAAQTRTWQTILDEFAAGDTPVDGGVTITAPEIAENGQAVPVSVEAPGASEIVMVNTLNPTPGLLHARFMEASGAALVATRIRLGETQDIIAYARFPDGSLRKTQVEVKVTIGGCGG